MSCPAAIYRTAFPGGIASISALRSIAELSLARGDGTLRLSSCQQLEIELADHEDASSVPGLVSMRIGQPRREVPMSTAGIVDFCKTFEWLSVGAFQEVLEEMPATRYLSVGVSDAGQAHVPAFTGDVTLVASSIPYYWRIAICDQDGAITFLPWAIPSVSTASFIQALVNLASRDGAVSAQRVIELTESDFHNVVIQIEDTLQEGPTESEAIVGIQPMLAGGRSCIGIYPEWGTVSAQLLLELCLLARTEQIGMVALTPYQSLLIPNISSERVTRWRQLIGRFQLSMYPPEITSQCLVGDDSEARTLATRVLSALVKERCHASGLRMSFLCPHVCGEAAIRIERSRRRFGLLQRLIPRYDLYCQKGFLHSNGEPGRVHSGLTVAQLIDALKRLIHKYNIDGIEWTQTEESPPVKAHRPTIACKNCGTQYDADYGDPVGDIEAGTTFDDLPEAWQCPVCESPKTTYENHLDGVCDEMMV
ncbi:MAG: rubredoxin [Candidatus Hydrogenedentota bacterium]